MYGQELSHILHMAAGLLKTSHIQQMGNYSELRLTKVQIAMNVALMDFPKALSILVFHKLVLKQRLTIGLYSLLIVQRTLMQQTQMIPQS